MSELIYLLAAVLFILSIRGLSAPRSARLGNFLGIAGMTLAIVAALALIPPERLLPVVLALAAAEKLSCNMRTRPTWTRLLTFCGKSLH